jgi:hypothetical protein
MSEWVEVPCLVKMKEQFDRAAPNRDKGADGNIGDSNHTSSSDHTPDEDSDVLRDHDADSKNEVHARDIDSTGPWPDGSGGEEGGWLDRTVHAIIAEEKRRWLDPNDMCRLNYVIWRGYIYDKDNDFAKVKYNGTNQHFDHAHFSARYETQAENDTRDWPIGEDDMTKEEFMAWMKEFHAKTNEGFATWMADGLGGANTAYNVLQGAHGKAKVIKDDTTVIRADTSSIKGSVAQIQASLTELLGKDFTDETAIINGVLAGLAGAENAAQTIADAVVAALPADLAEETARLILTKGGQAMVDAGNEIQ